MNLQRAGLWLALAALLVNGPRLVLIYLRVDGLALPAWAEGPMLGLTGIATGAVLTGGGMFIAHVLARASGRSRLARGFLLLCWGLLLLFAVVLIAPALVAGIRATSMVEVLDTERWQWLWAIVAVLAVEVLAAGAMVADALVAEPAPVRPGARQSEPSAGSVLVGALARRIAAGIEPAHEPPVARVVAHPVPEPAREPAESQHSAGTPCPQAPLGCDYVGATTAAVNAHQRFCKYKVEPVAIHRNGHGEG